MNTAKMLLVLISCISGIRSNPQGSLPNDSKYPPPLVELKYMNDSFTKELIISKSFKGNRRVPVQIELIKPSIKDETDSLFLTIENVEVSFALKENIALRSATYEGHLAMIPLTWPSDFLLETGSRIIFVIRYKYHLANRVVETGTVFQEIRF